jgi:hypothetical protein
MIEPLQWLNDNPVVALLVVFGVWLFVMSCLWRIAKRLRQQLKNRP